MSDDGVNLTSLRALGGKKGGQIALTRDTRTLTRESFVRGRVIACDPSLGGCGLATVVNDDHGLRVIRAERLVGRGPDGVRGMAKDTAEALDLREKIVAYVEEDDYECGIDVFEHYEMTIRMVREAPPVGGGTRHLQVVSSMQAGLMFDLVARDQGWHVFPLPMIYTGTHRSTICEGQMPTGLQKPDYHKRFLMPLAERLGIGGLEHVTNADTRDALAVALTSMAKGWS